MKNKQVNAIHISYNFLEFFVCCVILGLEYLHINNIIHRDIKPENLVLEDNGYLRITDFGIAKVYQKENSNETSGTPGYMSPEVIVGRDHSCVVDYFAVGVITYEFMMGKRPYNGKNRREIKDKIIEKEIQISKNDIPEGWSSEAADFINRLLKRKPGNRLGLRSAIEVKGHSWFRFFPWKDLYDKKIKAPFIPPPGDNFDAKYCSNEHRIGQETKARYEMIAKDPVYKDVFNGFTFYDEEYEKLILGDKKKGKKEAKIADTTNLIKVNFIDPYQTKEIKEEQESISKAENTTADSQNQIETKFIRLKDQPISSSNSTLMRQYKKHNYVRPASFMINKDN